MRPPSSTTLPSISTVSTLAPISAKNELVDRIVERDPPGRIEPVEHEIGRKARRDGAEPRLPQRRCAAAVAIRKASHAVILDPVLAEGREISYIRRPMNKSEAIAKLKRHADAIKALGATSLYLFGSVARDEGKTRSDLDLFIDYDPNGKFSLLELVGVKLLLEEKLGVQVDVTTRDSLHPLLRADIEQSAVRVF